MKNLLSFARKLAICLVAGLTAAATLLLLGNGGGIWWLPPTVVFPLVGVVLLAAGLLPIWWQWRERRAAIDADKLAERLVLGIRYLAAFNIASFGWKKIFGLQFVVPAAIASQPVNQLSGEWLTWFYFGHSPTFGLLIALIQLAGACLLLFRRTLLVGAIVLSALLLNLALINIFYQLNAGALVQSLIAALDVLFLLALHYRQLVALFLVPGPSPTHTGTKNLLRFSAVLLSLLFTIYLRRILAPV